MKIAISQSNYIPWKGYFDLIQYVDEFIFFDEVQFTRRDWRNRNVIRYNNKKKWLTIPIKNKGNYKEKISNIEIFEKNWTNLHLNFIKECYSKSFHFKETYTFIEDCYNGLNTNKLSEINKIIIKKISSYLKINTFFLDSSKVKGLKNNYSASERILEICMNRGANIYVSGPSAKNYLDQKLFENNNIKIKWFEYGKTKIYKQPYKDFYKNLSIVDCLMNCGKNKEKFLNY